MTLNLTDDERDFIQECRGSVLSVLDGDTGPVGEAHTAADALLAYLTATHPSRTERLLIVAALADRFTHARRDLAKAIMRDSIAWSEVAPGDWRSVGIAPYEVEWLSVLAGVTKATIRAWRKVIVRETLEEARAATA